MAPLPTAVKVPMMPKVPTIFGGHLGHVGHLVYWPSQGDHASSARRSPGQTAGGGSGRRRLR